MAAFNAAEAQEQRDHDAREGKKQRDLDERKLQWEQYQAGLKTDKYGTKRGCDGKGKCKTTKKLK